MSDVRPSFLDADVLAARRVEDAYIGLRHHGVTAEDAAVQMGLTDTTKRRFEGFLRAQSNLSCDLGDPTVAQFADHEEHVASVLAANPGGFPRGTGSGWIGIDGDAWSPL